MRYAAESLFAVAAAGLVAVSIGILGWEVPKDAAPRFLALETRAADMLPGAGLLMVAAGVTRWNGGTFRMPARVLYLVPNALAVAGPGDTLAGSVQVHLPTGPGTRDKDLLADMDARARYVTDFEGFLAWLEVRGHDAISGRSFTLRTTGTRQGSRSRYIVLALETYTEARQ